MLKPASCCVFWKRFRQLQSCDLSRERLRSLVWYGFGVWGGVLERGLGRGLGRVWGGVWGGSGAPL